LWLTSGGSSYSAKSPRGQLVDELFRVAERLDDPGLRLRACHAAWATTIFRGEAAGSREYVRQALALYDCDAHRGHALL
jgi:hypothetical protein